MSNLSSYTCHATWRHGRVVEIRRDREPVAIAPMPGTGRPSTGALDDTLATLGFTRVTPWTPTDDAGVVCGVEPIRG